MSEQLKCVRKVWPAGGAPYRCERPAKYLTNNSAPLCGIHARYEKAHGCDLKPIGGLKP